MALLSHCLHGPITQIVCLNLSMSWLCLSLRICLWSLSDLLLFPIRGVLQPSIFVALCPYLCLSFPSVFVSGELSFSGLLPSDTISSLYLLLNYTKASVPEESFRVFIVENAIKKKERDRENEFYIGRGDAICAIRCQ